MQEHRACSLPSSSSAIQIEVKEGIGSDDENMTVPNFGSDAPAAASSNSGQGSAAAGGSEPIQPPPEGQKKRGKSQAEKEHKRLKRLLRNRVSAQQARERKKVYLTELELRVKDMEIKNSELEERLSTMQNENQMLRQILKNTTAGRRGDNGSNASDGPI